MIERRFHERADLQFDVQLEPIGHKLSLGFRSQDMSSGGAYLGYIQDTPVAIACGTTGIMTVYYDNEDGSTEKESIPVRVNRQDEQGIAVEFIREASGSNQAA